MNTKGSANSTILDQAPTSTFKRAVLLKMISSQKQMWLKEKSSVKSKASEAPDKGVLLAPMTKDCPLMHMEIHLTQSRMEELSRRSYSHMQPIRLSEMDSILIRRG